MYVNQVIRADAGIVEAESSFPVIINLVLIFPKNYGCVDLSGIPSGNMVTSVSFRKLASYKEKSTREKGIKYLASYPLQNFGNPCHKGAIGNF